MSDLYAQFSYSTGAVRLMLDDGPVKIGAGWAGHGEGKNNPAWQAVKSVGPLPVGRYAIGEPFTHPDCGGFAMRLTPLPGTEMHGRDGMLIHGPSKNPAKYGQESNGCLIMPHDQRVALWQTGARILEVAL